jgi:hypothetical protein
VLVNRYDSNIDRYVKTAYCPVHLPLTGEGRRCPRWSRAAVLIAFGISLIP